MTDVYQGQASGLDSPARKAFAVSPSDSTDLTTSTRAIWVGTPGNIEAILVDDSASVTFANVPGGSILPIRARRVRATGTTAGSLVGLV